MIGLHHFGIIKALINARLLPRIISGASSGSIMSAVICTKNEEERNKLMNNSWNLSLVRKATYVIYFTSHSLTDLFFFSLECV
jgi:predicted acylesterase/phospholipase RssA